MNLDIQREKSHKSKTSKEIILTKEDKAKYNKLYEFLLQEDEDDRIESPKFNKFFICHFP